MTKIIPKICPNKPTADGRYVYSKAQLCLVILWQTYKLHFFQILHNYAFIRCKTLLIIWYRAGGIDDNCSKTHVTYSTHWNRHRAQHQSLIVAFDYVFSISLCVSPSLFICLLVPVLLPYWCSSIYPLSTCILSGLLCPNWKAELIIP